MVGLLRVPDWEKYYHGYLEKTDVCLCSFTIITKEDPKKQNPKTTENRTA
jgi:hypothetical protein